MRLYYAAMRFVTHIPDGIRNIVFWLPIVWHDSDYDYEPLLEMMRAKLNKMECAIRKKGCCVGHKDTARKIRTCVLLLDRIIDDEYSIEQFKRDQGGDDTKYLFKLMGKHVLGWWD